MRASIIITSVILISLSSCFTSQKLSIQSIDKLDSLEVQDPKNHLPVEGKGRFYSYTMLSDSSVYKIPNTHRVSSYFISQDTLRIILSPKGENPGNNYAYGIPVSNMESVTFRKFSVWRTVLLPVGILGVPVITVTIMMAIGMRD